MIQGGSEWFAARRGNVGASSVYKVMAKGEGKVRQQYMVDLLIERLGGQTESFTSQAIQRGTETEPLARSAYEVETGQMVDECGFIMHPEIDRFGASPDGMVGDDGLIEIKCPNTATHIDFIRTRKPSGQYIWQMQAQMACTGRQWCDFVSYDDRLPGLEFQTVRIMRDDDKIAEMLKGITAFLAELADLEADMKKRVKS
jgi:putative phage-type endonuclease